MVLYYLNHARANPLLKNSFSEMAYDVAAANSEAYLCDILQSSEKQWWKEERHGDQPYDPLAIHSTVLLTVHENQRASSSFPLSLMTPKFSAGALTQQDHCGPWSLPNGRPSTKDDVHLPLVPGTGNVGSRSNMQRGWFWLTEWVIDKTEPNVDSEGWQYGKSLVEANHQWTATPPASGGNWVRRRKWIRVMKKRLDLVGSQGEVGEGEDDTQLWGQEMAGNYIKRADLALRSKDGFSDQEQELQRYRQAIPILLYGINVDKDVATKETASTLATQYLQRAEELADAVQKRKAAYEFLDQLDIPRLQVETGSGSGNELRTLTLQKSRPYDLETAAELIHSQSDDDDTNDHLETLLEGHFAGALTMDDSFDDDETHEAQGTVDSSEELDAVSTQALPIPATSREVPVVAVISASPASAPPDSFPVARLTRIPSRASTEPVTSPPTISPSMSRHESSRTTRSRTEPEPTSSSSSYVNSHIGYSSSSPPSRFNQDRALSGTLRATQSQTYNQSSSSVTEAKWELDHKVNECRECHRKFSLWLRRHHCRRCGHVICDRCSSHRALLPPDKVVYDPTSSEAYLNQQALIRKGIFQSYRVCDSCFTALEPGRSQSVGTSSGISAGSSFMYPSTSTQPQTLRPIHAQSSSHSGNHSSSAPAAQIDGSMGLFGQNPLSHSSSRSSSSSNLHPAPMVRSASSGSLMSECPVCGVLLAGLEGGKTAQESHVQDCLEGKSGHGNGPVRYIVYKLQADSPLIDQECAICFEEFVAGRTVARLNCLCTYHRHCIHSWLQHGTSCPVHYR
ncbi:hypothetical protein B0O80DRAFT_857 [Mortierella sp. GBAus27b]|nr:hypothetical protein B0O80DRAFT_857 [Mortierella sp. GBAus27b]